MVPPVEKIRKIRNDISLGDERYTSKKLEVAFTDKDEKVYPIIQVDSVELANGLRRISEEIATRLRLQREQR